MTDASSMAMSRWHCVPVSAMRMLLIAVGALGVSSSSADAAAVSCPGSTFTEPVVQVSGNACFFTLIQPGSTEIAYSVNNVIQSENLAPINDIIDAQVAPNPDSIPLSATVVAFSQNNVSGTLQFNPQPTLPNQFSGGVGNLNNTVHGL